jgi:hypothetical protein
VIAESGPTFYRVKIIEDFMGLLLICPHCQTKIALSLRTCPACGGNLLNLARQDRRYFVYVSGPAGAAAALPQTISESCEQAVERGLDSYPEATELQVSLEHKKEVSLCEALDRILNKGAVLFGEVVISVADIDLVYLGLQVILASMGTARGLPPGLGEGQTRPNLWGKGA